jgi:CrcB protein
VIWLGVAATSAAGAVGRFSVMAGLESRFDRRIPWGTALVNLFGAFVLGAVAGSDPSGSTARLLGSGFLGSFTTFSTWMVESVFMAGNGTRTEAQRALLWLAGMLVGGIAAYGWGVGLAR